jgi:hypothetical protein
MLDKMPVTIYFPLSYLSYLAQLSSSYEEKIFGKYDPPRLVAAHNRI